MVLPTHIVAVAGFVIDAAGRILLVKDRRREQWTLPGGQVEEGENLIDALVREIREESGVEATVSRLLGVTSNTGTYPGHSGVAMIPTKVMFDFACAYISGEPSPSDETSEATWFTREEAADAIAAPHLKERFRAYSEGGEGIQHLEYVAHPEYQLKLKRFV